MSTPEKPRGGKPSELTRFKVMWRDSFEEAQRDYWRARFVSLDTQAQIRAEIRAKLKIDLTYDDQLKAMRDWTAAQRKLDLEAEQQADDERRLLEEHPNWTKDDLREALLQCAYRRAKTSGDFKLGLAAMKQDKAFMDADTANRRVVILETQMKRAQEIIDGAKNQGGLTPETLEKIERELKLL